MAKWKEIPPTPSPDTVADAIWAEFKDKWEGERKFALRQIIRWLKGRDDVAAAPDPDE